MNHTVIDLDTDGNPVDPETSEPIRSDVDGFLRRHVVLPENTTDVVVFVHGWRNNRATALTRATKFAALVDRTHSPTRYPALPVWNCNYIVVRWPSTSSPFRAGYRRIRERAHLMSTAGHAPTVLAHLLGYLGTQRRETSGTLRTRTGQYLHLVGHSFGCRFLAEAIQWAADARPDVLSWNRADPRYPWTADTLLMLQMALAHDTVEQAFPRLIHNAPVNGPVVFTHSTADRALGLWHTLAEGTVGIGFRGASTSNGHLSEITLHPTEVDYTDSDFATALVNVNASARFRRGRFLLPAGAHADIIHPETAHLLLSLAQLAR
ncbi:hypothetical protein JOD54_004215 [Actinokineospora baliensis]|uniref:alpha/beta hydrolase n=1 Tax=Actinokineospora baliensis TaxID=547056 RepID=UPI00195DB46B|nr:alpha/beta hydrolase [Actinokineospora baliensis]MBM7774011.1 hypothetical protein [Actinokineospora baliensis]